MIRVDGCICTLLTGFSARTRWFLGSPSCPETQSAAHTGRALGQTHRRKSEGNNCFLPVPSPDGAEGKKAEKLKPLSNAVPRLPSGGRPRVHMFVKAWAAEEKSRSSRLVHVWFQTIYTLACSGGALRRVVGSSRAKGGFCLHWNSHWPHITSPGRSHLEGGWEERLVKMIYIPPELTDTPPHAIFQTGGQVEELSDDFCPQQRTRTPPPPPPPPATSLP